MSTKVPAPDPALPHEAPGVPAVLEADNVAQLVPKERTQFYGIGVGRALEEMDVRPLIAPVVDPGPLPVGPGAVRPVNHVDLHPAFRAQAAAALPPPGNSFDERLAGMSGPFVPPPPPGGDGGEELGVVLRRCMAAGWIDWGWGADGLFQPLPAPHPQQGKKEGDPHDPSIGQDAPDRKLDGGSGC